MFMKPSLFTVTGKRKIVKSVNKLIWLYQNQEPSPDGVIAWLGLARCH